MMILLIRNLSLIKTSFIMSSSSQSSSLSTLYLYHSPQIIFSIYTIIISIQIKSLHHSMCLSMTYFGSHLFTFYNRILYNLSIHLSSFQFISISLIIYFHYSYPSSNHLQYLHNNNFNTNQNRLHHGVGLSMIYLGQSPIYIYNRILYDISPIKIILMIISMLNCFSRHIILKRTMLNRFLPCNLLPIIFHPPYNSQT